MISESGGRTAVTDNPVSEDPSLPIDATSGKSPEHSGSYNTPATSALHSMWNNSAAAAASFIAPQQQHSPLQRQSTTASMDRYSPLPPIPTTITHQMNNSVALDTPHTMRPQRTYFLQRAGLRIRDSPLLLTIMQSCLISTKPCHLQTALCQAWASVLCQLRQPIQLWQHPRQLLVGGSCPRLKVITATVATA